MCIGQDVRGNIKLSLKATVSPPGSEAKTAAAQAPAKQEISVWASVGVVSDELAGDGSEKKNKLPEERDASVAAAEYSVPSIVIRSAAECDSSEETISGDSIPLATEKSSRSPWETRSKNSKAPSQEASKIRNIIRSTLAPSAKTQKRSLAGGEEAGGKSRGGAKPLKLGDRVTAKVYQVRAHGLVLDLGGGVKGMYKFEVPSHAPLPRSRLNPSPGVHLSSPPVVDSPGSSLCRKMGGGILRRETSCG